MQPKLMVSSRPFVFGNTIDDTNKTFDAIGFIFNQIGMKAQWSCNPNWVKPNQVSIFVMQKPL